MFRKASVLATLVASLFIFSNANEIRKLSMKSVKGSSADYPLYAFKEAAYCAKCEEDDDSNSQYCSKCPDYVELDAGDTITLEAPTILLDADVEITGNAVVAGSLVAADLVISSLNLDGDLVVPGALEVEGDLAVAGALAVGGVLSVTSDANIEGVAYVNALEAVGAGFFGGALKVNGKAELGELEVLNAATVDGALTVGNAQTTFNGPTTVKNNFMLKGAVVTPYSIYGGITCTAANKGTVAVSGGFQAGTYMVVVCGGDLNWWALGGVGSLP